MPSDASRIVALARPLRAAILRVEVEMVEPAETAATRKRDEEQPKMSTTVEARAPIPLRLEACWEKLRDLSLAHHYVPGVTKCVVTTERKQGVGASRVVTHRLFGDMDETVVEWDEGVGFTIRLHRGERPAFPFREALFRYELEPADEGCRICTQLTWTLPWGPVGRILDALAMKRFSQANVRDVAVSLAEYYRTGASVLESQLPRLRSRAL